MSQPPLRHGQSSSDYDASGYQSSGSSLRYDQRNDYDEYPGENGDAVASREPRGGGYGGFDDATRPAHADAEQSHFRAPVTEYVNGGWHEEGQQEDLQRSGQSWNRSGRPSGVADGQGSRQIEG